MNINYPKLFIEINNSEFIFLIGNENDDGDFRLIYEHVVPSKGIDKFKIINFDEVSNEIKKNIYSIEQKLNFTFKKTVLIINSFECSFINLTGYQKLNGSQILKENISYILNSLKSTINETENKKTIIHIFNSKFILDKKQIENLPVGLFGDFYSHELSFCLLNSNDYKNLHNIFNICNLKIEKMLLRSFIEGSYISNKNQAYNTFYKIEINSNDSKIFYFENNSLKFEQNFAFGSDLITNDISKVTYLKKNTVDKIIKDINFIQNSSKDELIEKSYFENENYVKIKKNLIAQVAEARIDEILDKLIAKNVNLLNFNKKSTTIFLKLGDQVHLKFFKESYSNFFSNKNNLVLKFLDNIKNDDLIKDANRLVHFGWKKEAIPVIQAKKSILARIFDGIFS